MESWKEELYSNELYHHGIKGQQWGKRRYQNKDGSLTEEGRRRYLRSGSSTHEPTTDEYMRNGYNSFYKYHIGKANEAGRSWSRGRYSFRSYDPVTNPRAPKGKVPMTEQGRLAIQDAKMNALERSHNNQAGDNYNNRSVPGRAAEIARRDGTKAAKKYLTSLRNVNVYRNINDPPIAGSSSGPYLTKREAVDRDPKWVDLTTTVTKEGRKNDAMESNRRTALERIVDDLSKVGSQALDKVTETAKEAYDYVESVASQAATMASDAYAAAVEAGQNLLDQILGK